MLSRLGVAELAPEEIRSLAYATGFQKRACRKVEPAAFASLLLEESANGAPSCNDLAAQTEALHGRSVSRQAVCTKFGDSGVRFFQAILARAIKARLAGSTADACAAGGRFSRVLVQDSTVLRLPGRLYGAFSGVANAASIVCNARIQVVYDLVAAQFVSFSVDPYTRNDIQAAPDLELREGDLALRDRGYLSYSEIKRHRDAHADCICRHKHNTVYIDPQTQAPIDLATYLDRHGSIDMDVWLNDEHRTPVRLVAVPVDEELANLRRMKMKREMRRHAPSRELLHLASWTILVTTIAHSEATFEELLALYGLRWRIEIIFKSWKSHMNFARIHNVSERQLHVLLAARLTVAVITSHLVFRPARERLRKDYGRELSLMKTIRYLVRNPQRIPAVLAALCRTAGQQPALSALSRYCSYDKRKRPNFNQTEELLFASWVLS